jgi:hypothetical protein
MTTRKKSLTNIVSYAERNTMVITTAVISKTTLLLCLSLSRKRSGSSILRVLQKNSRCESTLRVASTRQAGIDTSLRLTNVNENNTWLSYRRKPVSSDVASKSLDSPGSSGPGQAYQARNDDIRAFSGQ